MNSCLKSDTISADRFDNMTCSYILLCGRNPWSILKWQLTELQIWSCQEPFPLFYIENRGFDVPDELCCNKCVSIEEITSTLRRYKQCNDKATAFDAIFDYANEANKQGYGKKIDTKEEFNTSVLSLWDHPDATIIIRGIYTLQKRTNIPYFSSDNSPTSFLKPLMG